MYIYTICLAKFFNIIPASIVVIILHLPTQYHHPKEQYRSHDLECKCRFPTITYIILRQPRQSLHTDPFIHLVCNVDRAVGVDIPRGSVELDGCFDQGSKPESEKDKGSQKYYAGNEQPTGSQNQHKQEEE